MSDVIRLLPDSVANQIAAGEVIQRPASVVKELVENAVDAGAHSIQVILKDAGRTLIQVIDDGSGMSDTDARMAFERHATSKISAAADLFELRTMGFRGEALASIAAIARVEVKTKLHTAVTGTRLIIEGSRVESQVPQAAVPGTSIAVKNLFFNVPARRRFLKKDAVELAAVMREFERLALVNPSLALSITHNEETLHTLQPSPLLQRIDSLFGKGLERRLIPVEAKTSLVEISGYVGLPEHARRRAPLQYLFVNGRNMRHPVFHRAVMECYADLLPPDMQPLYFLNFTVSPQSIDVNIHPTKNEIKFEDESSIRQILAAAIKEALGKYNAVPSINFDRGDAPEIPVFAPEGGDTPSFNPFRDESEPAKPAAPFADDWDKLYSRFSSGRGSTPRTPQPTPGETPQEVTLQGALDLEFETSAPAMMQLRNRYILTSGRDGVMIIDQHRAHMRVLYERYMKAGTGRENTGQRLIFPDMVQLTAAQNAVMEAALDEVTRLGFDLSPLGGNAWSILAAPPAVSSTSAADLLTELIEAVAQSPGKLGDNLRHRIALALARAAAVRPGQPLSADEIDRITGELLRLPSPGFTPDGRRIFINLNIDDIQRQLG